MSKPAPKPPVIHWQSASNLDKGHCQRRGHQSKRTVLVTCSDCLAMMHTSAPASARHAIAAMHLRMAP